MDRLRAVDALTALASASDPAQARRALCAAEEALGEEAKTFGPLLEVLCMRAAEVSRLRRLAGEDELTGAGNRRAFVRALERELAGLARTGQAFGLLLMDLDGLKRINDTYGHAMGDRAIITAVDAIRGAMRATDVCARIGGDELAVLLPDTDRVGVAVAAERMRAAVEGTCVAGESLRISVGWAVATSTSVTREELLALADARLYTDKHRRRAAHRHAA